MVKSLRVMGSQPPPYEVYECPDPPPYEHVAPAFTSKITTTLTTTNISTTANFVPRKRIIYKCRDLCCDSHFFAPAGYSALLQGKLSPAEYELRFHRANELMAAHVWKLGWFYILMLIPA